MQLLLDAAHSGTYRAARAREILAAGRARGLRIARIARTGHGGKSALLHALAAALQFPAWFGGNWDALEDCLTDLSWVPAPGYLILIEGSGALAHDEFAVLRDVLEASAQFWSARGKPFYAVFEAGPESLPELGGALPA
ncbi:MAG: barnase inhibitor [Betaproteobacteria bacterium]|nr:MAG: barnase inhibitor [Betaproteobacteria bacterium]